MNLISEINHALVDGLGKNVAASYKLAIFENHESCAIAYSEEKNDIYLLFLANQKFSIISASQYLNLAKEISERLNGFVVPNQKIGRDTVWGGKTHGPVYVYKFKVLNRPKIKT